MQRDRILHIWFSAFQNELSFWEDAYSIIAVRLVFLATFFTVHPVAYSKREFSSPFCGVDACLQRHKNHIFFLLNKPSLQPYHRLYPHPVCSFIIWKRIHYSKTVQLNSPYLDCRKGLERSNLQQAMQRDIPLIFFPISFPWLPHYVIALHNNYTIINVVKVIVLCPVLGSLLEKAFNTFCCKYNS